MGGRGGSGDFSSGRGSDEVLKRASTAFRSMCFGSRLFSFTGDVIVDPEEDVGRERGRFDLR